MPSKRALTIDDEDDFYVKSETGSTPPATNQQSSKKAKTKSGSASKTTIYTLATGKSAKRTLGEMIIEAGIKSLSKPDVQAKVSIWARSGCRVRFETL